MFYSRFVSTVFALATLGGLGACASAPKYTAADDADDYGHYSTRLDENRYRIVFNGNRAAGPNTTRDYALLRAAQLTLDDGYEWFQVVDRETVTLRDRESAAGFGAERSWHVRESCGLLGCTRSVQPWTSTRIDMDTGRSRTTHSHMLEIVMGKGVMPAGDGRYYDAAAVMSSIVRTI